MKFRKRHHLNTNKASLFLVMLTLLLVAGCSKEKERDNQLNNTTAKRVLIVNEGGFQFGTASLSVYLPDSLQVFNDIYKLANNMNLGDVAQSAIFKDSLLYVVVNNSAKVEVLNGLSFERKAVINIPGSSPRYIHFISNDKAYLTELYANKIWIFNPETQTQNGSINVNGWTEEMVAIGADIYVTERTTLNGAYLANVLIINSATNQIGKTISFVGEPAGIVKDVSNNVWVLCNSNTSKAKNAVLYKLSSVTQSIVDSFTFASGTAPSYLRINKQGNTLYYNAKGIYKMSVNDVGLPATALLNTNGKNVYAFNIDPDNGDIYIGDALDYTQSSNISRYSSSGNLIQNFNAGIITSQFVFR